jgi:hypothetical protein
MLDLHLIEAVLDHFDQLAMQTFTRVATA